MGSPTTKIVSTEAGDVTVRKIALGDFAELLRALKKLPAEIGALMGDRSQSELSGMDLKDFLPILPGLLADSLPEFATMMAVATDKDAQFFLDGDIADAIDVFVVSMELNDYSRILASLKKLMPQKPAAATLAQSPSQKTSQ